MDEGIGISLPDLERRARGKARAAVICNPNNPTGGTLPAREILGLARRNRRILFIVNEANIDLLDFGGESVIRSAAKSGNVLVVRSFSKGFGLAGLRVGFVVGSPALAYAMRWRQTPFSVNSFVQKMAAEALEDMAHLKRSREYVPSGGSARSLRQVSTGSGSAASPRIRITSSPGCRRPSDRLGISAASASPRASPSWTARISGASGAPTSGSARGNARRTRGSFASWGESCRKVTA